MTNDIVSYNSVQKIKDKKICKALMEAINTGLPEAEKKVWHGHPVWFVEGNPVVGYAVRKDKVTLLFWSGQSFDEPGLTPEGSFKAAEAYFTDDADIKPRTLGRWLKKAKDIQWDYKNIVKRKGRLERLK